MGLEGNGRKRGKGEEGREGRWVVKPPLRNPA